MSLSDPEVADLLTASDRPHLRHLLAAAGTLHPPRATSLQRFLDVALAGLGTAPDLEAVATRRREWLAAPPPQNQQAALERLVAEDLGPLLESTKTVSERIAAWADPRDALETALTGLVSRLGEIGIDISPPALHIADRLPPPYDPPSLAVVSIDRSDAAEFGLEPGIHLHGGRLAPFLSESVLGHVLVHVACGERSPEHLGRGFEEGIAEVLGGLHAAAAVVGIDAVAGNFASRRLTPTLNPHRASFLDEVRRAALVHRSHGVAGLVELVRAGRGAIKEIESQLHRGQPDDIALAAGRPDPVLGPMLDGLLLARGRSSGVSPLAFYLTRKLSTDCTVDQSSDALGVPREAARPAAAELMNSAFVLLLSDDGNVLVSDHQLALDSGALRYLVS